MSHSTGKETHSPSQDSLSRRHDAPESKKSHVAAGFHQPHTAPFSAQQVVQLQRTLGNTATRMMLQRTAAGPVVVQRAGDPEGLMKEHHASGFTYHHIIPENKLHTFWETLEGNKHTGLIRAGLSSVATRGLAQLKEAGISNIKLDLKKEIGEIANDWGDDTFEAIATDAMAGVRSTDLVRTYFPGLEDKSHIYHSSYQNIVNIFNKRFRVIGQTRDSAITATTSASGNGVLGDEEAKKAVNQLLMWMPGNIHRGPSKRFTPKDKAVFDRDLDDGGDEFEEAAKQVITAPHFLTVSTLNTMIDLYLENPSDASVLADISQLLDDMKDYSVTDYDPLNWEEVTLGAKKQLKKGWRLKRKV